MSTAIFGLGQLAHPFFVLCAWLLAGAFALVPNYVVAIALLTALVMIALFPLTRSGTLGSLRLQRLAPELKALQARFRAGAELDAAERAALAKRHQQALAQLYREHEVKPAAGCLAMLVQLPIFALVLGAIRGLVHTASVGGRAVSRPLYLAQGTALYHAVHQAHGTLMSLGLNLGDSLRSAGLGWEPRLFLGALVLGAVALAMAQVRQSARRATEASAPPLKAVQRVLPVGLGLVYVLVPAAVSVYFVVSSALRLAQSEYLYRHDRRVRDALTSFGGTHHGRHQERGRDER